MKPSHYIAAAVLLAAVLVAGVVAWAVHHANAQREQDRKVAEQRDYEAKKADIRARFERDFIVTHGYPPPRGMWDAIDRNDRDGIVVFERLVKATDVYRIKHPGALPDDNP